MSAGSSLNSYTWICFKSLNNMAKGKDRVMASKQMVERVFGLPPAKKDLVEKVKTRMKLFLYDLDPHSLWQGIQAHQRSILFYRQNNIVSSPQHYSSGSSGFTQAVSHCTISPRSVQPSHLSTFTIQASTHCSGFTTNDLQPTGILVGLIAILV